MTAWRLLLTRPADDCEVLAEVRRYSSDILVVNDGSTDGTATLLDTEPGLLRIDHPTNRGYGAALISAFGFALERGLIA